MSKCTGTLRDEYGSIRLSILDARVNNLTPEQLRNKLDEKISLLKEKYGENQSDSNFYETVDDTLRKFNYSSIATFLLDNSHSVDITSIGSADDALKEQYYNTNIKELSAEGVDISELELDNLNSQSDLLRIFNNNVDAMHSFMKKFNADIFETLLFSNSEDPNKIIFASTNIELNENIRKMKSKVPHSGADLSNALNNEVAKYANSNEVVNALLDTKNTDLYNMFIKKHFDKLLKLSDNNIISTTKDNLHPYKFSIQSHMRNRWTDNEFISFFDEIGSFSKSIMETRKGIKLKKEGGKFIFDLSNSYVKLDQMFYSINKLSQFIDRTNPVDSFTKAIEDVLTKKLVKKSADSYLQNISNDDLCIYLGLYTNFLNKNEDILSKSKYKISDSIKNLPNFYKASKNTFDINNYSNKLDYFDVVIANIVKQTGNVYTQSIYDYDTKQFKIETLNSAKINRAKFQLINSIEFKINNLNFESVIENLGLDYDYNNDSPILSYDNISIDLNSNSFEVDGEMSSETKKKLFELIHTFVPYSSSINLNSYQDYLDVTESNLDAIESMLPIAIRSMYLLKNKDSVEVDLNKSTGVSNMDNIFKGLAKYTQFINHETGGDVKSVIMSANDTSLPSYGLINMINEPRTMISFIKKGVNRVNKKNQNRARKRPNILANNFIIKNDKDLKKANINTFLVFGDSVNAVNKSYHQDVFYNNFVLQYLGNINDSKYDLVIQPTTFSDKNKQTSVKFDARNTTANWNNTQILNNLRDNTTKYYDNQIAIVKADLLDVLETFGITLDNNVSLEEIENNLSNLKSQGFTMQDIFQHAQNIGIELVDQLHFEKGFKLNSALKLIDEHDRNITNPNDKLYNKLINYQLKSFIKQLEDDGIIINMNISDSVFKDYISRAGKFIGYDNYDKYARDWVDSKTDRLILEQEGVINPILERYYLERALIAESYQHMTVGNELAHKAKGAYSLKDTNGDYVAALSSNMAMRYIAMTKRAVAHQATMHPYQLGLFNGVPYYENITFIVDPEMTLFNQVGSSTSQPVTDGASFSNMLSTILKNNSLLDQGGQIHHKSIGMSIDPYNGAAKLMKHADHNISNEKIRNSEFAKYNLKRLVKKMLDIPFDYDIDLTKDFNNKNIFTSLTPVRYNIDGNITKIESFEKIKGEPNIYRINGEDYKIDSLYKLWQVLGGEYSINENGVYDDSSWYNLAEFVNRVGFYKNREDLKEFMDSNGMDYDSFREFLNETRYDNDNGIEYTKATHRPSADSIYQPLKYNFISQATFTSAFKVGPSNINDTEVLLDNDIPLRATKWASIYTGLQLDHEHHTDDSDLSEPTQLISSIFFNGDAYQWNKQISTSIQQYVVQNIKKFFNTNEELSNIPDDIISNKINHYINQELAKKDISGFAINASKNITKEINNLVAAKRKALKQNNSEEFNSINTDIDENLPLSDSGIYNIIVNSINNLFTSLGIRRKLSGSANVQSPQTDFITVHNIDGKVKVAGMLTAEDKAKINIEIDLTNNPDFIQPFDVVDLYIDNEKVYDNYHLTDFDIYQKILDGEFDRVVKKPYAGRDLNPTMVTFDLLVQNVDDNGNTVDSYIPRNFYDTDAGTILIDVNNLSKPISGDNQMEILNRKTKLSNLLDRYNTLMNRYSQSYDRDETGLDSIQKAINFSIENPAIGLQLNKRQRNVLKNLQLKTYNDLKHSIYYTTSLDLNYGLEKGIKTKTFNYKEIPSEVMMPAHMQSKFLIDDSVDISDINENYYINKIRNIVLDAITGKYRPKASHIIIEANGEHVYCMPESELPDEAKLVGKYAGQYDNKDLLNNNNEKIANIGSIKLYELEKNGKVFRIATYIEPNDVYNIQEMDDEHHRYLMIYLSGDNEENSKRVLNIAKSLANNFEVSLHGAMARIPGQSKQSGMSFKTVGFIKTERNAAYTSPYFLWLAGADFDINISVSRNGNIMIKQTL